MLSNKNNLKVLQEILSDFDIHAKELITKNRYSVYIKDGEEISRLFALIGAKKAV